MANRLETDAAYYRECAEDCRRLIAAIEADDDALNGDRDDVLIALERDHALWLQLADELDEYRAAGGRGIETADLLDQLSEVT